jgi:rod shape-determining protein MreD
MQSSSFRDIVLIGLTFIVAMMLLVLPFPDWVVWYRPAWVFMVLIFWMMVSPDRVGIGVAWFVGLFLDLLTGTMLGQHALVLSLIAYFMLKFQAQIHSFPIWQQTLLVFFLMILYVGLQYWLMALMGLGPDTWKYGLSILTTTLLWPWVSLLLTDFQYRYKLS